MFSVLMSIYKNDSPDELEESYNSLLKQGSFISQFVLVCDGPVGDALDDKVLDFESKAKVQNIKFDCIRLETNEGLGKALAIGQTHCQSDYIVRMDSDDISLSCRFEDLSSFISLNKDIDVIGAQIEEFIHEAGDLSRFRLVPLSHDDILNLSKSRNPMNHVTACIKRSSLEACGGYESMLWHEDYYLWIKMLQKGFRFANLPQIHVAVRVNELGGRRSGFKYLNAEFNFLFSYYGKKHFTFLDKFKYIILRIIFRLSPPLLTSFLYKKLRT